MVPVVLSDREVRALLAAMEGTPRTMALLFYGAGLRILECVRLRIKDVDFDRRLLTLQDTNGGRARVTMLPEAARGPLRDQIQYARELYDADRSADAPRVQLPHALEWKTKRASTAWEWYWVFPSPVISKDPRSGIERRHHVHEDSVQRAVRAAAKKVGISKRVTPHGSGGGSVAAAVSAVRRSGGSGFARNSVTEETSVTRQGGSSASSPAMQAVRFRLWQLWG
jgi:integrase